MLHMIKDCVTGETMATRYANATLADLFAEWAAVEDRWNNGNNSDILFDAFRQISNDLEVRMVDVGVHSAADAKAVIDWHRAVYPESAYDWGYDAVAPRRSGALWDSLYVWLETEAA